MPHPIRAVRSRLPRRRTISASGRDERGVSLSAFVATIVVALLAMGGLVIDGGAQSNAVRECQQVAAEAARAASDAGSLRRAAGQPADLGEQQAAALSVIASRPSLTGTVSVAGGVITVRTSATVATTFLSLIRINSLPASGEARAVLAGPP